MVDALYELTAKEIEIKNFNATNAMVKVAGFPHLKEMKDFDFDFQPKINKKQFLDFHSLRFLESNSNIILIGNSGVEKTHHSSIVNILGNSYRTASALSNISNKAN
ncbi:ATP-binding protein [Clostridium brassicae]|uniref:ATP-binding protein n=1 Tax=Clostridium brassicae TaxID=2999072 RepID=A0ABT4D7H7_9CLOT|nr:ATP-binding protein [Clostridium brassicae]MCY6957201.1 ATP-binding protein [Clostridium brassicae]